MIRFILRRLLYSLPTLIGITLATFVLLNLAMEYSGPAAGISGPGLLAADQDGTSDFERMHGLHLPLFLNLSIEDVGVRTRESIRRLGDPNTSERARKRLIRLGGAGLPYLIPALAHAPRERLEALITILDGVAARMDLNVTADSLEGKVEFWQQYWETFGPDFTPVRAARLVDRMARREDPLAQSELRRLDTFALPQIMDEVESNPDVDAQARLIDIAGGVLNIEDPLPILGDDASRDATLARWSEWWARNYDEFTDFSGTRAITGAISETRYFRWMTRLMTLDFGVSLRDSRPISNKLAERLPITLFLSVVALLVAYLVAIPLGIASALLSGGVFDRTVTILSFILFSLPTFWVAILLIRFVTYDSTAVGWSVIGGFGSNEPSEWFQQMSQSLSTDLVLPIFCLSYVSMAMLIRYQRVGMLQVKDKSYLVTARAKGLSPVGAFLKHGLRNGLIPLITMLGLQLPYLVSGSVIVERIFGIPGMGYETFEAIRAGDHPWLMAVVTVTAALTMLGVVASDALYAALDPRISPGQRKGRA